MKLTAHPLAEALPSDTGATAQTDQHLMFRLRISLSCVLAKGEQFSATFYALLFERHPALRALFPADMKPQQARLTETLAWIVTHLHARDKTLPAVRELGRRHVGYGTMREHYPQVRDALIDAMRKTAGPEWNDGLAEDWRLSIDLISRHMQAAT